MEATLPTMKLSSGVKALSESSILQVVSTMAQANIQSAIMNNSHSLFDAASDAVIRSKVKYIIGTRGASTVTSFLSVMLKDTLPLVFCESSMGGNTFDFLSDITKDDCLIVTSFARYSKLSYLAAELAKEAGATVIVITDKATAPIGKCADYLFLCNAQTLTFFNSHMGSLFVAEVLVTYICQKIGENNADKLDLINRHISQMELY